MKNAKTEYTREQQQAAKIAAQIDPADAFWHEVDQHLQKRAKQREGLVKPRPGRNN